MPSPTAIIAASSLSGNSENFTLDVDSFGDEPRKSALSEKGSSAVSGEQMALIVVDERQMDMEKYDHDKEEERDGISMLLSNWSPSSKPVPWRRDSCEFTTCIFPCVKKATSHLQQLKTQLDRLLSQSEETDMCSVETDLTDVSLASPEISAVTPHSEMKVISSETHTEASSPVFLPWFEPSQSNEDIPSGIPDESVLQVLDPSPSVPARVDTSLYQTGYEVIGEVVRLLGRLERDRQSSQEMLSQEIQRVNQLRSQIDRLAFKRLLELPASVQKEHESCVTDINELKWHCGYRGRLETRIKKKVDYAETQYAKFIDDVESAKRSCPLVQEKLDLEAIAIASIQGKQDETDEELRKTLQRLEATQKKTNEAKQRAAQERTLIKKDVDVLRNLLNEVSDGLAQLKMNYTSNVHTVDDIKNTLKENTQQCFNLEKREERVQKQEEAAQDKVVKLKEKITEQGSEHAGLLEENESLRKNNLQAEQILQGDISKIKMEITSCQRQVREMTRLNKSIREDLESTEKFVEKCKKQKKTDKRSLVRAAQEIEKVKQQNQMMSEETKKVMILNTSLKTTKIHEEASYLAEEETLKSAETSLRSQLKEEAHMRTVLQARIASDSSDLLRSRIESTKKKDKVSKQAEDSVKVVARIKEQVSKLEKARNERFQTISQLNAVLDKLLKQRNEMETKYRAKITQLRNKEEIAQKEKSLLDQNLDQITWKSDRMEKKMADMSSSTIMMSKVSTSNKEDIAELEEDNKEMKLRLESSLETKRNLKQAGEEAKERITARQDEHTKHVENRKKVLEGNMAKLKEKLSENKALAENYQSLHCKFMQLKEEVFKYYESLVNEESHLKDHKELDVLQRRMRECLQHYYKLRGLRNKAQVAQFKVHSKENNDKVFELKQDLTSVVQHINTFLESNNAAHQTISMNATAMAQTPVK